MTTLRDAMADGGSRSLGFDSGRLAVKYLRFFSENKRRSYGFNPEVEDEILALIKSKYLDFSFTEADKEFILANLIDPAIGSNHDHPEYIHSMHWLVNDIRNVGVTEPMHVYWDAKENLAYTTAGNRRLTAIVVCKLLDVVIESVPILQESVKPTSAQAKEAYLERQIRENSGRSLTPLEQYEVLVALKNLGKPVEQLIQLMGSKQVYEARMKLGDMSREMQALISKGHVAPTAAIEVVDEALEQGLDHQEITQAVIEAVEEVKDDNKNGKTKTRKASKKRIKEKVAAKAKASGIGFKSVKPDDPVKVQGLKQNILYAIQKESVLDKLSYADLKELFQILNK